MKFHLKIRAERNQAFICICPLGLVGHRKYRLMLFGKANVKMFFVYTKRVKSEHASFFETENQMGAYHVKDMHKKKAHCI